MIRHAAGAWETHRMRFDAQQLATDLGGRLHGAGGAAVPLDGLAIDSRDLRPGQLFAAVDGERDGHDFVGPARSAGAAAALVEREVDRGPSIVVPDVRRALLRLAAMCRRRLPEPVVGITGSVGKTTTKDLLASVLGATMRTAASPASFNNELGLPITLANAPEDTEATVLEMGARGHGHISLLCSLAHPDVGVVTAVEAVHTELMGNEAQIAVAKRELVESLPPSGLAVLNADDPWVAAMAAHTRAEVLTFGQGSGAAVRAEAVTVDDELRASFHLASPWGGAEVRVGARGAHNVVNALAAAAVGLWLGAEPAAVARSLAEPPASRWRMELARTVEGTAVLNDAYNAGPASMAAALRSLAALPAQRRIAVLGTMAELGDRSAEEHERIAQLAESLGIEVLAVGTELYGPGLHGAAPAEDAAAAAELLEGLLAGIDPAAAAVLVKGSRVAGLDLVAESLLG